MKPHFLPSLTAVLLALARLTTFAQDAIDINAYGDASKLVPISVTGFSGEAEKTLKFDLEIAGFKIVPEDAGQYQLTGSNKAEIEGQLNDKVSKAALFRRAYPGAGPRVQAHSLANDVVAAILKVPGIARTRICFKGESGKHSEIFLSDYDGNGAQPVTSDNTIVAAPNWAPGRKMLYYTSYRSGYPDIYQHDLTSGERRRIAAYPGLNTSAAVSPNGRRVAMILSKGGSPDLFVCDSDGGNLLQLTSSQEGESSPCWSPDGGKICYAGNRGLYIISSGGGKPSKLSTDGASRPSEPDWSPDGKTIIFTTQNSRGFDLCKVPASGGTAEVLVAGEDPSWAPNSRTVVFTRRVNNKRVLSLLDVPSKRVKDVLLNLGNCSQPAWAR